MEIKVDMESLRKTVFLVILFLILTPIKGICQRTEPLDTSGNTLITAAKEIMTEANTCALITLDDKGFPRVRAMDPFAPEDDLTVWFGTNSKSRKVDQIMNDPRVTLYYLAGDASGYVTLHGVAKLIDDPEEKKKRWKEEWSAFYGDRQDGYLLIKVTPHWMEIISYTHGIVGDPVTWQPPIFTFDSIQ